jgi:hypothetical protein
VGFIGKLQERWKVDSPWKVLVILTVFALTGTTVVYLKRFIKPLMGDFWWFDLLYYIASCRFTISFCWYTVLFLVKDVTF